MKLTLDTSKLQNIKIGFEQMFTSFKTDMMVYFMVLLFHIFIGFEIYLLTVCAPTVGFKFQQKYQW